MTASTTTTTTTTTDVRLLAVGTVTEFGTTERSTMTGWFMTDGNFVPFVRMQPPTAAMPLVTLG